MHWVKIGEVVVRFIESGTMERGGFIQAQKIYSGLERDFRETKTYKQRRSVT
jgi:hypothetical protein